MNLGHYDSIIVGAGHNGLVCAGYLARRGQKVLVLEAASQVGGLAAGREFFPGFHVSVAQTIQHFSEQVATDLNLAHYEFNVSANSLSTVGLQEHGEHVVVSASTVAGVGDDDAVAYQRLMQKMQRFADVLKPFWLKTMPRIGANSASELMTFAKIGLKLRLLGKDDMREFLRVASLPVRDLMDEYFDSDLLKSTLSWDGLVGAKLAPRSPNGAILALLYRMSGASSGGHNIPAGGIGSLIDSLYQSAIAHGVEIRTSSPVERIAIDGSEIGLRANGVRLVSGETIRGTNIISAADPQRTFLNLVGVENLDIGFTNRIRRLRCDGYVGKLHLALNGEPKFNGVEKADERLIIAANMDSIEFAFDHAKYGECSERPVMEIVVPSFHDASLAPSGKHVLSANVMYLPYRLKGGWTDEARAQICNRAIAELQTYAPAIRDQILASELLTPADLENEYNVSGGHWHHTELAFDQMLMMRPTYDAAQYRTPIASLYLCGSGCHPGGGLTGAGGHNAAREIPG